VVKNRLSASLPMRLKGWALKQWARSLSFEARDLARSRRPDDAKILERLEKASKKAKEAKTALSQFAGEVTEAEAVIRKVERQKRDLLRSRGARLADRVERENAFFKVIVRRNQPNRVGMELLIRNSPSEPFTVHIVNLSREVPPQVRTEEIADHLISWLGGLHPGRINAAVERLQSYPTNEFLKEHNDLLTLAEVRDLLEQSGVAAWYTLYNGDDEIVEYANAAFAQVLGKSVRQILEEKKYAVINPKGAPIQQYKDEDAIAIEKGVFIARGGDPAITVVKIRFGSGILGMFVPAASKDHPRLNSLEPALMEILKFVWPVGFDQDKDGEFIAIGGQKIYVRTPRSGAPFGKFKVTPVHTVVSTLKAWQDGGWLPENISIEGDGNLLTLKGKDSGRTIVVNSAFNRQIAMALKALIADTSFAARLAYAGQKGLAYTHPERLLKQFRVDVEGQRESRAFSIAEEPVGTIRYTGTVSLPSVLESASNHVVAGKIAALLEDVTLRKPRGRGRSFGIRRIKVEQLKKILEKGELRVVSLTKILVKPGPEASAPVSADAQIANATSSTPEPEEPVFERDYNDVYTKWKPNPEDLESRYRDWILLLAASREDLSGGFTVDKILSSPPKLVPDLFSKGNPVPRNIVTRAIQELWQLGLVQRIRRDSADSPALYEITPEGIRKANELAARLSLAADLSALASLTLPEAVQMGVPGTARYYLTNLEGSGAEHGVRSEAQQFVNENRHFLTDPRPSAHDARKGIVEKVTEGFTLPLKAVVFDLDGTLSDDIQALERRAFAILLYRIQDFATGSLDENKLAWAEINVGQYMSGLSTEGKILYILAKAKEKGQLSSFLDQLLNLYQVADKVPTSSDDATKAMHIFVKIFVEEIHRGHPKPIEGALDLLDHLHHSGVMLGMATGEFEAVARAIAKEWGIESQFLEIYGKKIGEPDSNKVARKNGMLRKFKEPLAAQGVGIRIDREIALWGDTPGDTESAKYDGSDFTAIGFTRGKKTAARDLKEARADYLYNSGDFSQWKEGLEPLGLPPAAARLAVRDQGRTLDKGQTSGSIFERRSDLMGSAARLATQTKKGRGKAHGTGGIKRGQKPRIGAATTTVRNDAGIVLDQLHDLWERSAYSKRSKITAFLNNIRLLNRLEAEALMPYLEEFVRGLSREYRKAKKSVRETLSLEYIRSILVALKGFAGQYPYRHDSHFGFVVDDIQSLLDGLKITSSGARLAPRKTNELEIVSTGMNIRLWGTSKNSLWLWLDESGAIKRLADWTDGLLSSISTEEQPRVLEHLILYMLSNDPVDWQNWTTKKRVTFSFNNRSYSFQVTPAILQFAENVFEEIVSDRSLEPAHLDPHVVAYELMRRHSNKDPVLIAQVQQEVSTRRVRVFRNAPFDKDQTSTQAARLALPALPDDFDLAVKGDIDVALESLWLWDNSINFPDVADLLNFMNETMGSTAVHHVVSNNDGLRIYIDSNNGTTWPFSRVLSSIRDDDGALENLRDLIVSVWSEESYIPWTIEYIRTWHEAARLAVTKFLRVPWIFVSDLIKKIVSEITRVPVRPSREKIRNRVGSFVRKELPGSSEESREALKRKIQNRYRRWLNGLTLEPEGKLFKDKLYLEEVRTFDVDLAFRIKRQRGLFRFLKSKRRDEEIGFVTLKFSFEPDSRTQTPNRVLGVEVGYGVTPGYQRQGISSSFLDVLSGVVPDNTILIHTILDIPTLVEIAKKVVEKRPQPVPDAVQKVLSYWEQNKKDFRNEIAYGLGHKDQRGLSATEAEWIERQWILIDYLAGVFGQSQPQNFLTADEIKQTPLGRLTRHFGDGEIWLHLNQEWGVLEIRFIKVAAARLAVRDQGRTLDKGQTSGSDLERRSDLIGSAADLGVQNWRVVARTSTEEEEISQAISQTLSFAAGVEGDRSARRGARLATHRRRVRIGSASEASAALYRQITAFFEEKSDVKATQIFQEMSRHRPFRRLSPTLKETFSIGTRG